MAQMQSIAQFLPAIQAGVGLVTNVVSTFGDAADEKDSQNQALMALRRRQNENIQQAQEDAALERDKIVSSAKQADLQRRKALKRAVARQRANFAGSGITGRGGSSEAVLLGLFDESDIERQDRARLDQLRFNALDQNLDQRQRLNLIQRAELQERNKLNLAAQSRQNIIGTAEDVIKTGFQAAKLFG